MEAVDDADLVSKSLVRSFALLEHLDLNITHDDYDNYSRMIGILEPASLLHALVTD